MIYFTEEFTDNSHKLRQKSNYKILSTLCKFLLSSGPVSYKTSYILYLCYEFGVHAVRDIKEV